MHLKAFTLLGAVALALVTVNAAEKVDNSKLPPVSDKKDLTFDKDIKPILEKSCFKCHGAEKPKGKYRVDSKEAFLKAGDSETDPVVPGKSADSPVVHMVSDLVPDYEMPPLDKRERYPALTKEQVGILRAWIDQGAKK